MRMQRPRGTAYINNKPAIAPSLRSKIAITTNATLDESSTRDVIAIGNEVWPSVMPYLVHRPATIQAGILAQIVSLWLTAYTSQSEPQVVEDMTRVFVSLTRAMTALNSQMLKKSLAREEAAG